MIALSIYRKIRTKGFIISYSVYPSNRINIGDCQIFRFKNNLILLFHFLLLSTAQDASTIPSENR